MASNVEKFLIQFDFLGKDALKGLKQIATQYDNISKGARKASRDYTTASRNKVSNINSEARALERIAKKQRQIAAMERAKAGKVASYEYSTAFQKMVQASPELATSSLKRFQRAVKEKDVVVMKQIVAATRDYSKQLNKAQRNVLSLRTAQGGLTDSTRNMIRAYASLFTVFAATQSINRVGQSFEAMESAMLAAMGSQDQAASQIEFLDQLTSRLGMSLLDTADQYTKFVFASKGKMPTEEVNQFFQSVAEAGTVLGISKERMKLSFNALQQMLNKTTVQSEELKRQLAESFPGAIQIFAKAVGKSEQEMFKMMENGELLAAEIFPAVADEMAKVANKAGALEAKYKTTRVAQGRFFKELEKSQKVVFKAGFDESFASILNYLAEFMKENQQTLKAFGRIFQAVFNIIGAVARIVVPILSGLISTIGELFHAMDRVFGKGSGEVVLGIYAITKAVRVLSLATSALFFKWFAILGFIDEVVSLFVKGREGLLEDLIGQGDLGLDMEEGGIAQTVARGARGKEWGFADLLKGPAWHIAEAYFKGRGQSGSQSNINLKQENNIQLPAGADEERLARQIETQTEKMLNNFSSGSYMGGM